MPVVGVLVCALSAISQSQSQERAAVTDACVCMRHAIGALDAKTTRATFQWLESQFISIQPRSAADWTQ
ncbi:MAG: hypothetical protein DWI10_03840 [Planctomycetota bacterium]|nr:MAG: hypothetical protein DWI10_03840 [Planctomycetota bacterium]